MADLNLHCLPLCESISIILIKQSYWLKIRNGCSFSIYSAGQGLRVNVFVDLEWSMFRKANSKSQSCLVKTDKNLPSIDIRLKAYTNSKAKSSEKLHCLIELFALEIRIPTVSIGSVMAPDKRDI